MKKGKEFLKGIAVLSTLGINLVVSTFIGFFIGRWLDNFFKTSPWLTIIFFIFGVIAGFVYLIKTVLNKYDKFSD